MKKKIHHYYSNIKYKDTWKTACGRDGRKTGGFIDFFFKTTKITERCKICNKHFEKEKNPKKGLTLC